MQSGDPEIGRNEVMDADRAFAAAAQVRGLDGWMEYIAPDAARLHRIGTSFVRGHEEIRRADAAIFADPARRMIWEPTDGGLFAEGNHGFTTGRYQVLEKQADGSERLLGQGGYVSVWRREADGRWLIIMDTGAADPPPAVNA